MKRILAVSLIGLVFSLTACGNEGEPTPTKTVYVQPSDSDSEFSPVEREFLYDINLYATPELNVQPDADLVRLGRAVCASLDSGFSLDKIVSVVSGGDGLSRQSILTVAASAIVNFCPEHKDVISS